MHYYYSSRRSPCPVCEKDHGCRIYDDGKVWCLRVITKSDTPSGYRYLGSLQGGMGSSLAPDRGVIFDRYTQLSFKRELREARERRQRAIAESLSSVERDTVIRQLSREIGLSTFHREYLRCRRLTDAQIDSGLFFSLLRYQPLPSGLPYNFPGTTRSGSRLSNDYEGIACVLFSPKELAIGIQVRLTNCPFKGRYRWLCGSNGQNSSHLRNGELPLTFVRPTRISRQNPAIVEGTGIKPRLAADLLGQIVIGASGGQHVASPVQLSLYLEAAVREMGCDVEGGTRRSDHRVIDIYPDAGDIGNSHVCLRLERLASHLHGLGYAVRVGWWRQEAKEAPDIDELENVSRIVYLPWIRFAPLLRCSEANQPFDPVLKA